MICPNITSPEWKALVDKVGENRAWKEFLIYGKVPSANNYEIVADRSLVKPGVAEVFNGSKELSDIGNLDQYNAYINTIFPDSKVKDIMYHGAMEHLLPADGKFKGYVTYFTTAKSYAETFGFPINRKVISAVVNVQKPYNSPSELADVPEEIHNTDEYTNPRIIKAQGGNYDAVTGIDAGQKEGSTVAVFEPEQIVILGSKQDQEGFKKYVAQNPVNKGGVLFRSIRTKSTEQIAAGINKDLIRSQNDLKYTSYIMARVIDELGDISPNKKLDVSPSTAFKNVRDEYTEVVDNLKMAIGGLVSSDEDLAEIKASGSYNEILKDFPVLAYVNSYNDMVQAVETYENILTNFDKYKESVIAEMARKGIRMRMDKNTVESIDPTDVAIQEVDDTENIEISQDEIGERYGRESFETNTRDTATVRLKLLVQTIKTGDYEMGIPIYADPNDVFADILQAGSEMALSGYTDNSSKFEIFKHALEKRLQARPYLADFIAKINDFEKKNEWEKINDILTFATKAFANETVLLYKTRKDGNQVTGITDVKVINANRDTVEDQVSREWLESHKQSAFFNRSSLNELKVNPEKLQRLGKIIEEGKAAVGQAAKTAKFKEFFATLGIEFTDAELGYITPRLSKALGKGPDFDIIFGTKNLLDNIYTSFTKNASQVFDDNYGFQDEKGNMRKLATLYYEANPGRYKLVSAQTADGKQKYLYILTNFIEKKKRQWNLGQYANVTNSALARPNRSFWDKVKNGVNSFIPQYFNGIREQQAGKDGKVRKSLTEKEQTVTMLLKHQENLKVATYINFTLSDKTTTIETKMTKEFFVDDNDQPLGKTRDYIVNIKGELEFTPRLGQRAYDAFVAPEVSRILAAIKHGKDINLENFDIASKLFYFIPSLNSNPNLEEFRSDLYAGQMNIDQIYAKHSTAVGQAVLEDMQQSAEQQIDQFIANGIIKVEKDGYLFPTSINGSKNTDYVKRLRDSQLKGRDAARLMMMDMKLNYQNTQVKMIQFLRFDPALAFKKFKGFTNPGTFTDISGADRINLVSTTWDEFSKRAAALIAPGSQGSYSWKTKDGETYSSPSYEAVTAADVDYKIGETDNTTTDAQEYITLNEHIDNLMSEGKIPLEIWQSIYDKIEKAGAGGYYELSGEELGYVFTPTKPVQVNDVDEGSAEAGLNRIDYVKSSRYPLIPQHEAGSERDKMRGWMERNNIRAINFASGKKLGRPVRSVTLFNKNGSEFIEPSANDTAAARQTLSREGLRTQQEIPHQKDQIRTVSQMNRTLFDNMLEESFSLKGIQKMSGTEAKGLKELVRSRLFEKQAEKLQQELGDLNRSHRGLHRLLKDVILNDTTGSYGENDLKSIELDEKTGKFKLPLEQQFKLKKFQGLINSLINKNVMLKVEGSSFVQVSGVGAKFNFSNLSKGVKSGIIWTDSYAKNFKDGDVKLNYIRKEGDQVKPAQVIVSQYLRDKEGNLIDLSQYITEKNGVKILDTSKFSPEMFELVGTRIPNQSHPSMLPIEVVGFLPAYMENTIIVPDGITGQMGSDFDVDKLYAYISKMEQKEDKFVPVQYELNSTEDVDKLSEEQLGQLYRDIHWMALTHPAAYDKITKSIDMPEVKRKVAEREAELKKYGIADDKGVMLPLDFMTSINRFNDNRSGKVGVGVFANLISAQADFQDKVLTLGMMENNVAKEKPIKIRLSKNGKVVDLLYLGKPGTSKSFVGKTRTISENLNIMFTESVDNAKNQYLREFNWEEKAMSAIGVFEMLTDESGNAVPIEFVMDLTSQEAIKELFTSIDQKQDSFGEFDSSALDTATLELKFKYANALVTGGYFSSIAEAQEYLVDENRDQALDPETLDDMWLVGKAIKLQEEQKQEALEKIAKDKGYTSVRDLMLKYNTVQHDSLELFKRMEDIGRELNTILGSVYTYTKGIGPNVFATRQKLTQLNKISGSTNFLGLTNVAGVIKRNEETTLLEIEPQGEIGASIKHSLMVAQDIYRALFPISSGRHIEAVVDKLMANQGKSKEELGKDSYISLYDTVFNGIKAYLYTMPGLELFQDSRGTRDKLVNGDTSLGKRIMDLSKDPEYRRNGFLKNLEVKQAPKQKAFTVNFKAPFGTDLDEKAIISGFYELATSDKEEIRQLAKDLAIYPFVTGDAGNMGRFIPVDYYLSDEDFSQVIAALDRVYSMHMDDPGAMQALMQQIVQNNPDQFAKAFKYSTYGSVTGTKDNVFKRVVKKLVGKEELKDVNTFTIKIGDFEADPKGNNIAKSLEIPLSKDEAKSLEQQSGKTVNFKYPAYILINDTFTSEFIEAGSRNVNYLYKRVSFAGNPVGTYERINILGYNGIKEYDFNNPDLASSIEGNNNVEDETAFQETVKPVASTQQTVTGSDNVVEPYPGVLNVADTGLTVDQANEFIDLLQPQIQKQAYIENKAATANRMFSFGLRWAKQIPNVTEKSKQNSGSQKSNPRPDKVSIQSMNDSTYGYYTTDQNNQPLPKLKELEPIMQFVQSKINIDLSNYDSMLANIYEDNSFIHQHRDITESKTAGKYPVVVINIGADGALLYDKVTSDKNISSSAAYAEFEKNMKAEDRIGTIPIKNGGIYAFGVNGVNRFTFSHRIKDGIGSTFTKPIIVPVFDENGIETGQKILTNYRITLTFRKAMDLKPGEPVAPIQQQAAVTGSVKPTIDLSREWSGDLKTRSVYTAEGVNTMRTEAAKPNEHFGNPFSEAGYGDTRKVPSIPTAVQAYKDWLLTGYAQWLDENGEAKDFAGKTEQRQWILDQINQGKLDGATLLYAGKLAARGQGMHPTALAEVVEQLRSIQSTPQVPASTDKFAKKNIFSIIPPNRAVDRKAAIKASIATQYIGFGQGLLNSKGGRSSTEIYREQAGEYANTGNYNSNDVIFVSIPGRRGAESKRKEEQDKTIREAIKAVKAGATILTDNKVYTDSSDYNTGEKRLYKNMEAEGFTYSEITVDDQVIGTWSNPTQTSIATAEQNKEQKVIKAPQEDQESVTMVTYGGRNFILEENAGSFDVFYANDNGTKGATVEDRGLFKKVQLTHAISLYPERVVSITIGSKENSYYVIDDRIFSLQLSSFGDLITSDDVTRRVMQQMNTPMQEKQVEQQEPKKSTTTFTYKNITVPTEFQLSAEQSKALENIIDFVEARSAGEGTYDGTYTLEGYAGTGKTSIIGVLDRYISQKAKGTKFIYMAPTHAATVALGNNIVKYGARELPMTIQASVTESKDPRRPGPKFTKKFTDRATGMRNVIVLDEASMLANKDFEKLILAAKAEGYKIIFMGDPKQIPEVMPGVKTKELARAFANPNKSVLTSVFRTKDNNILTVLTNIRNNTDFMEYEFESTDNMKQLNRSAYNEELINDLQNNLEDVTIINYTNEGVAKINKAARQVLGYSGPLKPGEKIVGYLGSQTKQVEKGHLANSVSYMVQDVSVRDEGAVVITATSKALEDLQKAGMTGFPSQVSFRYLQLSVNDSLDFGLNQAQLDNNKKELERSLKQIHELNELYQRKGIAYPTYLVQVQAIRTAMADFNTGAKYIYNPASGQIEPYDSRKHKGINANLEMDKGVDFGYGITIHKSQGMTIPIVYFDTNSLSVVSDTTITRDGQKFNTEKNALYYVGMSRASQKLVVPKNTVAAPIASQSDFMDGFSASPEFQMEEFDPLELFLGFQEDEAIDNFVGELFRNETTVTDYKGFLNKLYTTTSAVNKAIITAISKTGTVEPVTFKVDMSQPDPGTYNRATRTITINPKAAIANAVDTDDMQAKIHEVIMHELVHHVTVDLLMADQTTLSPEQRKWVKGINNLFDQVQTKMLEDPQHSSALLMAMANMSSDGFMSAKDKSLYYGLTSVYDFVTMMMTDKGFQNFMNTVPVQGDKTILDRFMDLLVSLIKSLGIQVKDNSALDEGLRNIIGLMGARTENNVQKSIATESANRDYIEKNFDRIINVLNIKTKC